MLKARRSDRLMTARRCATASRLATGPTIFLKGTRGAQPRQASARPEAGQLSKRHDISRQLIRIWVDKYEAGALDDDVQAADLLQEYEARIAALERMVGRQALEIEFLKGALKNAPRPRSANAFVVTGPVVSRSAGD